MKKLVLLALLLPSLAFAQGLTTLRPGQSGSRTLAALKFDTLPPQPEPER